MLNVNEFLAKALASGGIDLPASEDPMREPVKGGAYITWQQGRTEETFASGEPVMRKYPMTVCLWVQDDSVDWRQIRDGMADAINSYDAEFPRVDALARGLTGAQSVSTFNGRVVSMQVTVWERLWTG